MIIKRDGIGSVKVEIAPISGTINDDKIDIQSIVTKDIPAYSIRLIKVTVSNCDEIKNKEVTIFQTKDYSIEEMITRLDQQGNTVLMIINNNP